MSRVAWHRLCVCLLLVACVERRPSQPDPTLVEAPSQAPKLEPPAAVAESREPSKPKLPRGCIADLDSWRKQLVLGEPNVELLEQADLREAWAHSLESVRVEAVELDGSDPEAEEGGAKRRAVQGQADPPEHFVELRFGGVIIAAVFIEREPGLFCSIGADDLTVVSKLEMSGSGRFELPELDGPAEFELVELLAADRKVIARRQAVGEDIYSTRYEQSYFELRDRQLHEIFRFTLYSRTIDEGAAEPERFGTVELVGTELPKTIRTVEVTDCTDYRDACRDDPAACAEIGIEGCKPGRKTKTWRYRDGKYR